MKEFDINNIPEDKRKMIDEKVAKNREIAKFCTENDIKDSALITYIINKRINTENSINSNYDMEKSIDKMDSIILEFVREGIDVGVFGDQIEACTALLYGASKMLNIEEIVETTLKEEGPFKILEDILDTIGANNGLIKKAFVMGPDGLKDVTGIMGKDGLKGINEMISQLKNNNTEKTKKEEAAPSTEEEFNRLPMEEKLSFLFKKHVR